LRCQPDEAYRISEEDKTTTETHLTRNEIKLAVQKNAKLNKSPGPSGFTFEFYKKYEDLLSAILLIFYEKVMA
ncbi:Uncharacterized protein FKW44_020339, partial [Caligus rogercresseyi]